MRPAEGRRSRVDLGLLIFVSPILWGVTFPAAKRALDTLPLLPFMAWSRVLGFGSILVALLFIDREELTRDGIQRVLLPGFLLGGLMFGGYTLQTWGLERTTATNAGFITGLYVVLTPILGLVLFGKKVVPAAWVAVAVSVVGLGLLAVERFDRLQPHSGDLLVLAGAAVWAAHITFIGRFAPRSSVKLLSLAQMGWAMAFHLASTAGAGMRLHEAVQVWPLLVLTGVLGSGVAFTVQVVAQREIDATRAVVILAGESLVSAISAAAWLGERLALRQYLGAGLILGAMVLSEVGARRPAVERVDPGVA